MLAVGLAVALEPPSGDAPAADGSLRHSTVGGVHLNDGARLLRRPNAEGRQPLRHVHEVMAGVVSRMYDCRLGLYRSPGQVAEVVPGGRTRSGQRRQCRPFALEAVEHGARVERYDGRIGRRRWDGGEDTSVLGQDRLDATPDRRQLRS